MYDNVHERALFTVQTEIKEWVFNPNSAIFQLYHGENKLISMKWWWCSR